MRSIIGYCHTCGGGYWTQVRALVGVTRIEIAYVNNDTVQNSTHGELRAYFDPMEWNVDTNGIIYTDGQWITDFRLILWGDLGYSEEAVEDVTYSEAGMQSSAYVSLDIGPFFLRESTKLYRFTNGLSPTVITLRDGIYE